MDFTVYLRRNVIFLPRDHAIEFRTSDRVRILPGSDRFEPMSRLAAMLDGSRSQEEILAEAAPADHLPFSELIEWLEREKFLQKSPRRQPHAGPLTSQQEALATYLRHVCIDDDAARRALADTVISVLGDGLIAFAVARAILILGMRSRVASDTPWLPRLLEIAAVSLGDYGVQSIEQVPKDARIVESAHVVILAPDGDEVAEGCRLAVQLYEAGQSFIYAGLYKGLGLVSPIGSSTAAHCFLATLGALEQRLNDPLSRVAPMRQTITRSGDAGPIFCGLVGQQAALSIFSRVAGLPRERDDPAICIFDPATLLPAVIYLSTECGPNV